MWALRPPPLRHHLDDHEGPIDLRKKAALDRDFDHDDHGLDDSSPKDLTVGRRCHYGQQQQNGVLPVRGLHPFMAVRYGARCNLFVASRDEDVGVRNGHDLVSGHDLRNDHDVRDIGNGIGRDLWNGHHPVRHHGLDVSNRHDADPRNGHDFRNGHYPRNDRDVRNGHVLELPASRLQSAEEKPADEKEPRCKSTDAVFGKEGGLKAPRSSSCPDLTCLDRAPIPPSPPSHLHENGHFPTSPMGGAKKRKSFVPAHGDRSPSPTANLALGGSPSPKRPSPVYVHKTHLHHHSPSPECRRSPSPPVYGGEKLYYSPRGAIDVPQRRYHSPSSPPRPPHLLGHSLSPTSRGHHRSPSPPPRHQPYQGKGYRSPSPYRIKGYRSPSPTSRRSPPPQYDEYFSHPEVLLRRQLGHHHHQHPGTASPFYLHVYDYYQHLVQRLREQSSPSPASLLRGTSPPDQEMIVDHVERKRPCRALTGKHVRQGTGASLSTLLSLRQMIQERQKKAKERQPMRPAPNGSVRKFPPKKARLNNGKSPLSKVSC